MGRPSSSWLPKLGLGTEQMLPGFGESSRTWLLSASNKDSPHWTSALVSQEVGGAKVDELRSAFLLVSPSLLKDRS